MKYLLLCICFLIIGCSTSKGKSLESKNYFNKKNNSTKASADPIIIRNSLKKAIPEFRSCFPTTNFYERKQNIVGLFVFSINNKGKSYSEEIKYKTQFSNLNSVIDCQREELRKIQFPKPIGGGDVKVKQPFNFNLIRNYE